MNRRAFSLIELLVVVTVISVLATLAMSTLGLVRDISKGVRCSVKFHELGMVLNTFVENNDGRFPGYASNERGYSVSWLDLLGREVLNQYNEKGMQRLGIITVNGVSSLNCDAFKVSPGLWRRSYGMNPNVTGNGTLGRVVDPAAKAGTNYWYTAYHLGTKQARFTAPSTKVMMNETEQPRDSCAAVAPFGQFVYTPCFNNNPTDPLSPYAANGGFFAFRHRAAANFLFVDLHVERIPFINGEINQRSHYAVND